MVKINTLELENIKRIRAVRIEPSQNGLTVIGGRNNQGKTSVLDAIAWALGGNKFRPSQAQREGSLVPPHLKIQLSNGLVVERKGKNSDLKVTDPAGNRSGQLRVATAIVRRLNPQCGFVLLDKLEQMDVETLREFGEWLEQEGLQAIATRVSTGSECSIIIEDGYDKGQVWEPTEEKENKLGGSLSDHAVSYSQSRNMENKTWKVGEF